MDLITASEALFQEMQDDWKAIDDDSDHDQTEKGVLKQDVDNQPTSQPSHSPQ